MEKKNHLINLNNLFARYIKENQCKIMVFKPGGLILLVLRGSRFNEIFL
jgi:hypothetical protein